MALLTEPVTITFEPRDLQKVLVLSSFTDDDPLKDILTRAINTLRERWDGKVEVIFKKATTLDHFVEALNSYDGQILIFDGHGADNASEPIGKLVIGDEAIDVWKLQGKVRVPPIVILSACDTHGLDASSHATVGNGFLFLGARTVLATLLPVNAFHSALFVARLVYRLADFIPAALSARKRVLNWTEIISGMLRMAFASELLDELIGPPAPEGSPRSNLQLASNVDINLRQEDWYGNLLANIARERNQGVDIIESRASAITARCESIRYIQLGNPETILVDDGSILKQVQQAARNFHDDGAEHA
ncbi:CHAT domain-containing protein [Bradyrhizobium sp. CB3481]|uniref:CHAT domain-containing protein n=1 Tax=Bradyrhizobium sp. CB3481 TaxID=3039158 RepID=UPI0024B183A7|nr:CHAT domain-containing protein [Bradyrhizobium sp. CB3481]WFU16626.1 CHAT domain-containing protein [Bradyrhizobium sp. CB3481]